MFGQKLNISLQTEQRSKLHIYVRGKKKEIDHRFGPLPSLLLGSSPSVRNVTFPSRRRFRFLVTPSENKGTSKKKKKWCSAVWPDGRILQHAAGAPKAPKSVHTGALCLGLLLLLSVTSFCVLSFFLLSLACVRPFPPPPPSLSDPFQQKTNSIYPFEER